MNIQLAVDNAIDERILSNALSETNYNRPSAVDELPKVKERIESQDIDLVITGKRFNDKGLIDVAQAIRSTQGHPYTPIMATGTEFTRDEVIDAIQAGVNQIVLKPIRPVVLSDKIARTQRMGAAA